MIKLEKAGYNKIYKQYLTSDFFFPLIAAVLLDEQDGVVYVDNPKSPSQVYVEHAFGFSQVFGQIIESFEQELERYLLVDKCFNPDKIRLYAPYLPAFLALPKYESLRSYRQRFTISAEDFSNEQHISNGLESNLVLCCVDENNISLINNKFGVVRRFWRSSADFIRRSNAVVVFCAGKPASICYSAAEAKQSVEIDVFTLVEYRNLGLGNLAVTTFVNRCFDLSLRPLWDCFTNNAGSMMLCKSIGFMASNAPYPFFTINK
jgi:hypothetical protein